MGLLESKLDITYTREWGISVFHELIIQGVGVLHGPE